VVAAVEAAAANAPRGDRPARPAYHGDTDPLPVVAVEDDLEQVHLVLGMRALPRHDPDRYAFGVLNQVLGGGMSSRLFQEVREKRGLCYSIYAFQWGFSDAGIFGVSTGSGEAELKDLIPVILDEMAAAADAPREAELARAKAQMKAGQLMALESSSVRAEQLARHILVWGRPLEAAEIVARIDKVTLEDVRRAGRMVLASAPTVTALGPVAAMPGQAAVARHLRR